VQSISFEVAPKRVTAYEVAPSDPAGLNQGCGGVTRLNIT
jgi:hypothetical protein